MIRILLVDDHTIVRQALRVLLEREADMQVVAEACDGLAALQLAAELRPDIVVMDIGLPGINGIETTRRLRLCHPASLVLALSTTCNAHTIQQMFQAGASGYVVKSAAAAELCSGLRSLAQGERYLCPQAAQTLANDLPQPGSPATPLSARQLSQREIEVAVALARGGSAHSVAAELCIAASTVEVHRRNILRKLGLHKTVDLARAVIDAGLLRP